MDCRGKYNFESRRIPDPELIVMCFEVRKAERKDQATRGFQIICSTGRLIGVSGERRSFGGSTACAYSHS